MSPWVRLNDSAMTDLKIVRLPDSAFRLWVKGLCYCQMHLTDGVIPTEALGPMEAKKKDIDVLCTALVAGKSPLWERVDGGYHVHDYLDYNDSRTVVIQRQEKDRQRKRRREDVQQTSTPDSTRNSERSPNRTPQEFPFCSVSSSSDQRKRTSGDVTDDLGQRAANLLEKYAELYQKHRHGAKLLRLGSNLQWLEAVELCRTWDDARLEKLIEILLTTNEEWVSRTDRGWKIFVAKATWCDERLAAWEAERRPA